MRQNKVSSKRKIHCPKCLHKNLEIHYSSNIAIHLKPLEQMEEITPQIGRWQQIIKLE